MSRRRGSGSSLFPKLPTGVQEGLRRLISDNVHVVTQMLQQSSSSSVESLCECCASVLKQQQLSVGSFLARFFDASMLVVHCQLLGKSTKGNAPALAERIANRWARNPLEVQQLLASPPSSSLSSSTTNTNIITKTNISESSPSSSFIIDCRPAKSRLPTKEKVAAFFQTNSQKRKVREETRAQDDKDAVWDEEDTESNMKKGRKEEFGSATATLIDNGPSATNVVNDEALALILSEEKLLITAIKMSRKDDEATNASDATTFGDSSSKQTLLDSLTTLRQLVGNKEHLINSGVGRLVRGLKKHKFTAVSAAATALVADWKAMCAADVGNRPPKCRSST